MFAVGAKGRNTQTGHFLAFTMTVSEFREPSSQKKKKKKKGLN